MAAAFTRTTASLESGSSKRRAGGPQAMLRFLILGLVMLAVAVGQFVIAATVSGGSVVLPMVLTAAGAVLVIAGIVKGVRR